MTPQRLGPRPLPLHMAMEGWIVQAAMAGLMPPLEAKSPPDSTPLSDGWAPSNPSSKILPDNPLNHLLLHPARLIAVGHERKNGVP